MAQKGYSPERARAIRLHSRDNKLQFQQTPCDVFCLPFVSYVCANPVNGSTWPGIFKTRPKRKLQVKRQEVTAVYIYSETHNLGQSEFTSPTMGVMTFLTKNKKHRQKALIVGQPGDKVTLPLEGVMPARVTITLGEQGQDALVELETYYELFEPIKHSFELVQTKAGLLLHPTKRSIFELDAGRYAIRREKDGFIYPYEGIDYPLTQFTSGDCYWLEIIESAGLVHGAEVQSGEAIILPYEDEWPASLLFIAAKNDSEILLYQTQERHPAKALKLYALPKANGRFLLNPEPSAFSQS